MGNMNMIREAFQGRFANAKDPRVMEQIRRQYADRLMQGEDQDSALTDANLDILRARAERMRQPIPDFYGDSGQTYQAPQFGSWDNALREAFLTQRRQPRGGMSNVLAELLGGMK